MKRKHTIHFDEFDHSEYRGWAWAPSDASTQSREDLIVRFGPTTIGRKRRDIPRPDVDAHLGGPCGDTGFILPIAPLVFLGQIVGDAARFVPAIHFGGKGLAASELPPRFRDMSTFRSLVLADAGGPFLIADLWLATSHQLRLRLEPGPTANTAGAMTLRFYQPRLSADGPGTLDFVHEQVVDRIELTFVTVPLANPLLPLLIVAVDAGDEILATDLLPYPSLCRGGLHAAELSASGLAAGGLSDLRVLSDSLAREYAGWSGSPPPRSIGKIVIDCFGASGAEPIFRTHVVEWLRGVFGVELELAGADRLKLHDLPDTGLAEHLRGQLASSGPILPAPERRPLKLTIPNRAIPTISALVSRRLADVAASPMSAPFLVADAVTARPKWLVSLPPTGGWLDALQPATSGLAYPTLSPIDDASDAPAKQPIAFPAAVVYHEPPLQPAELKLFPVSQDYRGAVLRAGNGSTDGLDVSLIVSIREHDRRFEAFLESVARQTIAGRIELIVVNNRSYRHREAAIQDVLHRTFPSASRIVEYDETFNHSAQLNLGARSASGRALLFANSSIVLHDARTAEILLHLAEQPQVASASCMLLHRPTGTAEIAFRSAGYFPGSVNFMAGPHVSFVEPDCCESFPVSTYPVAANSLDLTAVRAEVFAQLGGLDERKYPSSSNDIDFAMRAMREGLVHLCTTATSAYCDRRRTRGTLTDVAASSFLGAVTLADLVGKAAVLRKL